MKKDVAIFEDNEASQFGDILSDFINEALTNKDKPVEEWLGNKIHSYLQGDKNESEKVAKEITEELNNAENRKKSLDVAIANGQSKESWFSQQFDKYWEKAVGVPDNKDLAHLDQALGEINKTLEDKILGQEEDSTETPNSLWDDIDISKLSNKDLTKSIGKNAGKAGLKGFLWDFGSQLAGKVFKGEKIEKKELLKDALETGADKGVKSAVAGAIKVASEKGLIKALPKGTPVTTVANIASVAVDDAKILYRMAKGDISVRDGIEQIERTTVAAAAGYVGMTKGAAIGASWGACLGPAGAVIGGFIGGCIGGLVGSKAGETSVKIAQNQRKKIISHMSSQSTKSRTSANSNRTNSYNSHHSSTSSSTSGTGGGFWSRAYNKVFG